MKVLTNQITWGCLIIGITLGILDIYVGEKVVTNEGAGRGRMAIAVGLFCGMYCINRITKSKDNFNEESESN